MIDDKTIELIHGEVDGENTPEQSAALRQRLKRDAAARELHAELTGLGARLSGVEAPDPPLDLKRNVLAALDLGPEAPPEAQGPSRATGWPLLRFAYVFVAGLIVGIGGYHLAVGRPALPPGIDDSQLSGAMRPSSTVRLKAEGVSGTIECRRRGRLYAVEFTLSAPEGAEVTLDCSGSGLEFSGFSQQGSRVERLAAEGRRVTARLAGEQRYTVLLDPASMVGPGLDLEFRVSGELVYRDTLELPDE